MKAAIYCRVSTEDQEREGTSLKSQLEACIKKADELGYESTNEHSLTETYSGLTLDRPKLSQLREWVRNKQVDAVISYTLDRLSRDPVHFIILQEELERAGVALIMVTEDVDGSDMGKLIAYIKGFAAKLEAEKIKERTARGMKERVKSGKLPGGQRSRLFGYIYIPGKGEGKGIRIVNEVESKHVRDIFNWYVTEGLSIHAITLRLRELQVPTPTGKGMWGKSSVYQTLRNLAYMGKTYLYDKTIEAPGATPAIITEEVFLNAQARFERNKALAPRNRKYQYLLSGYVFCRWCGRRFSGGFRVKQIKAGMKRYNYYRCPRGFKIASQIPCANRTWNANELETLVWQQIQELLSHPDQVFAELERRKGLNQSETLEKELVDFKAKLIDIDKEQQQLLQWAMKGFPEDAVNRENDKINRYRVEIQQHINDIENRIRQVKQTQYALQDVEKYCTLARRNLSGFTYEDKRLALEALQIEVWIDGEAVSIKGFIPPVSAKGVVASTLCRQSERNQQLGYPFYLEVVAQ
jgi:site-specific DNA recombinase